VRHPRAENRVAAKGSAGRGGEAEAYAAVAVDVLIFSIEAGQLRTLLVPLRDPLASGRWAFPGCRVRVGESLDAAVGRALGQHPAQLYVEQLRTFGDPARDPHGRVVSIAYLALAPGGDGSIGGPSGGEWFPLRRMPPLAYDHAAMACCAVERLRSKLSYTNIVFGLLSEEFTLGELQGIYEIILDRRLDRRNFRKKILSTGLLQALSRQRRGAHRPARLYRFAQREPAIVEMV
jgi:8-oxo-dGTP diphosphatase